MLLYNHQLASQLFAKDWLVGTSIQHWNMGDGSGQRCRKGNTLSPDVSQPGGERESAQERETVIAMPVVPFSKSNINPLKPKLV
jgi:hypothetical protein